MATPTTTRPDRVIGYGERAALYAYELADTIDQSFLAKLARAADGPVVEVPCGSGRNLRLLAATGRHVTGIDLEPAMVRAARRAVRASPDVRVEVGDMRAFGVGGGAALVLVPREAFQLLPTYADALAALHCFRGQLRPGGTVMLDLATFALGSANEQRLHPSYFDPRIPDGRLVHDWARAIPGGRLERCHWQQQEHEAVTVGYHYQIRRETGPCTTSEARIRLLRYSEERVAGLLAEAGLRPRALLGDYEGEKYRSGSPRLIVIAAGGEG